MLENSKSESFRKRLVRRIGLLIFLVYVAALVYFLFFAEWHGHTPGRYEEYQYNLMPFREIGRFWRHRRVLGRRSVYLNLGGNVAGFLPFGFFLPVITKKLRSGEKVTALGACFSIVVELVQLLTKTGSCDVDDVMLNTLGTAAGYLLFLVCDHLRLNSRAKHRRRRLTEKKRKG
ncbi:MAG: VanZ family protein [Lachnospiraceae bacterium]|nr:VanZ family protein [Lachnospiraceae bacterium]